jgi:hypothetical protein
LVRVLPVSSKQIGPQKIERYYPIIDNGFFYPVSKAVQANQAGGTLYDNKGKLLYRREMKNGLPHGYGKVGHVGLFKGGKIVQ